MTILSLGQIVSDHIILSSQIKSVMQKKMFSNQRKYRIIFRMNTFKSDYIFLACEYGSVAR